VEETMELLRQFVADAAHEINTPIAVIEASVQTLEATIEENQLGSNVLAIISRASGRMRALGQSLIVLSRLESSEYQTPLEPLNLEAVLNPVVAECDQLAKLKKITLVLETVPEARVLGDAQSLERMILNLIANSVRYTDEGGQVKVICQVLPDTVKIIVQDDGIGIPAESLPHVFQRFYRVDKSRSRELGGFGLGLAIVKAIVDRHRGEIEVASELGKGTSFTVSLRRST
jgi:two-component system phosphate regulon sensor histidine kinase PhoR